MPLQTTATLRIGPGPAYLIRTKHHVPPTYFGSTLDKLGRSSVFAFSTRRFAVRVALGLESHRRAAGSFPVLSEGGSERLELGSSDVELGDLAMVEIEETDADRLHALVDGSGVVVCYMRMDGEDEEIHAHVVYDKQIQKTWIHKLFHKK